MLPSQRPSNVSRRSLSLVLLCAVQGLERFAFLAMLPLFLLYANDRHAMTAPMALLVLGVFQALSNLGGWPAGWLIDRILGARASALLGAVLLACGYAGLALDRTELLWPALVVMVAGHSFIKPGLHVLLGSVATTDERTRERTFLWHYLAANAGYIAGALFGEWAHTRQGWTLLFAGAAAALALGVALLAVGLSWFGSDADKGLATGARVSSAPAADDMRAVWLLCGVAVVFWLTTQQAGSSLTLFAAMNTTQRATMLGHSFQVGPGYFASLHGLLVLALLAAFLILRRRVEARAISPISKMLWGYVATAAAFVVMATASVHGGDEARVNGAWLVGCYVFLSLAEVLLAPLSISLITQLSPKGKTAQAVGLWFASCALGNGLAGVLGLCWDRWPHHRYFALLALLSLGAAAVLLPRRRKLGWLTALCTSASSQPVVERRMDTMTTRSNLITDTSPSTSPMPNQPASFANLLLVGLPILLPGVVAAVWILPLPMRGVCAIVSGLAVLLCGPYLFSDVLVRWARRSGTNATPGEDMNGIAQSAAE